MRVFEVIWLFFGTLSVAHTFLSTPDVFERVQKLKDLIRHDIQSRSRNNQPVRKIYPITDESLESADYDYYDSLSYNRSVTPIDNEALTLPRNNQLTEINATPSLRMTQTRRRIRSRTRKRTSTPETYYRRSLYQYSRLEQMRHTDQPSLHCHDLITPYLAGIKDEFSSNYRQITYRDHIFVRFIQLITIDTTNFTMTEIYSVLYQINNLNLQIFLWNVPAITLMMNGIIGEDKHSFKTLKNGLKKLFTKWRLDFSNVTTILNRARMFRPPCILPKQPGGSTKHPPRLTISPVTFVTKTACKKKHEKKCEKESVGRS